MNNTNNTNIMNENMMKEKYLRGNRAKLSLAKIVTALMIITALLLSMFVFTKPEFAKPKNWVYDKDGILNDSTINAINDKNMALSKSGTEIFVVVEKGDSKNKDLVKRAEKLFKDYKVNDNSMLFIMAVPEINASGSPNTNAVEDWGRAIGDFFEDLFGSERYSWAYRLGRNVDYDLDSKINGIFASNFDAAYAAGNYNAAVLDTFNALANYFNKNNDGNLKYSENTVYSAGNTSAPVPVAPVEPVAPVAPVAPVDPVASSASYTVFTAFFGLIFIMGVVMVLIAVLGVLFGRKRGPRGPRFGRPPRNNSPLWFGAGLGLGLGLNKRRHRFKNIHINPGNIRKSNQSSANWGSFFGSSMGNRNGRSGGGGNFRSGGSSRGGGGGFKGGSGGFRGGGGGRRR